MQGGAAGRDYPVEHLLDDIALINPCYWTVYMYLLLLRITLATKISALKERDCNGRLVKFELHLLLRPIVVIVCI